MKHWHKIHSKDRIKIVDEALKQNVNFSTDVSLGYPASKLDGKVFYDDAPFLKDAPVLKTFVANPNHIGCHTLGTSEIAFKGTQGIEREVLAILAEDLFKCEPGAYDGYIASGGTEANLQAIWVYRNFFMNTFDAKINEISIIASSDTHYSIAKAANLLMVDWMNIAVDFDTRVIERDIFRTQLDIAIAQGKKYFIVVANMGTTMFGSVDDLSDYTKVLDQYPVQYKLHIDAAYGGFVYPFLNADNQMNFAHPKVSSITVDAHKMLQAPYGTGIFLCRKGLIENVLTKEAAYVEGMDLTLSGSRSGANAVAVWMILATYGFHGWFEKVKVLQMRTDWLCKELDTLGISYFREKNMNIVTLKANDFPDNLAEKFNLVPQQHNIHNQWYKIVVMDHVEVDDLEFFLKSLKIQLTTQEKINI
jgi:glutamate/tyrosine decarboxylase-like PLP-dependent enzyme